MATGGYANVIKVMKDSLQGGGPSTRVADIYTRAPTPHTVTARKLYQFDAGFYAGGITCTPAGNVLVCEYERNTVRMYTPKGDKMMDLQTPPGTQAFDVDSTDTNIYMYVTDRNTESVLVFDHQGRLVTTNKINNVTGIRGISVSNRRVYIAEAEADRDNVLEMDLSDTNTLSTQRQFAGGVKLNFPIFVCARGDVVAISSEEDHCVHCVDSRGRIKFTHGTPGQAGSSHNTLSYPQGVVFDKHNNLFICNSVNKEVCVVSDLGRLIGHIDLGEHQLEDPCGITIDTDGNLLVTCSQTAGKGECIIVKFGYSLQ